MSWRAESTFVSERQENEKQFQKVVKKLREIEKLEQCRTGIEANQQAKIDSKQELLVEISQINVLHEFWERYDDIYEKLDKASRDRVLRRKRDQEDDVRRKDKEKEERKVEALKAFDVSETRRKPEPVFTPRHERPVTDLVFDEEHKVLYSSSKDKSIVRWDVVGDDIWARTTLSGHEGAVWCLDVHRDEVISGGADGLLVFWDRNPLLGKPAGVGRRKDQKIQEPKKIHEYGGIIRGLRVHDAGICLWTDKFGPKNPAHLACLSRDDPTITLWRTEEFGAKINMLDWGRVGSTKVFSCHDDGKLSIWGHQPLVDGEKAGTPPKPAKLLKSVQVHEKAILSMNWHKHFLLTASTDCSVKAINSGTPDLPTVFHAKANRPLRAVAAWDFPEDKCFAFCYGGGRDPRDVTTSHLLPDEFEMFQTYIGNQAGSTMTRNCAVGPLHRILWIQPLMKIFTADEGGEVKMWEHDSLQQYIKY